MLTWFRNQKIYIQVSFILLLIFIILITPITFLLSQQFSKYVNQEITRFTQENTYQAKERVNHILNRLKFFSFSIYTDERIQEYLSLRTVDPSMNRDIQVALSNYILNEPFADSVYVINPKNKTAFSSKQGPMLFDQLENNGLLSKIDNETDILQYFKHESDGRTLLGLIVATKLDFEGYLIVFFDAGKLSDFLLQTNHDLDINVMFINDREELLLGETEEFYATIKKDLIFRDNEEGHFQLIIDQEPWLINYDTLDSYDSKIYTLTKVSSWNDEISHHTKIVISLMLCLILFLFMIVFLGAYRTYHPFTQLSDHLKDKFYDLSINNHLTDYKLIKQGIDMLEDNVNQMNFSHKEYRRFIKLEHLRQWILQERESEFLVKHIKEEFGFFIYKHTYFAIIRIDSYQAFVEEYNFTSRKTMKYAIGKIIEEVYLEQNEACDLEIIDFNGDHIVFLINTNTIIKDTLRSSFMYAKKQIRKFLHIKVTIAVSDPINIHHGLRSLYNKMYEISNINFITGEDRIYQENDYVQYRNILHTDMINVTVEKLIKVVKLGQEDQLKKLLGEIINHLRVFSHEECKFQLSIIMYQLFRSYNQHTSLTGFQGIQAQLGKFEEAGTKLQ